MKCVLCQKSQPAKAMILSPATGAHFCPDLDECAKRSKRSGFAGPKTIRDWKAHVQTLNHTADDGGEGGTSMKDRTPDQKKTVAKMVKMREKGDGIATIANKLNEAKVPTFGKGKQWYAITVRGVLIGAMGKEAYDATRKRVPGAKAGEKVAAAA